MGPSFLKIDLGDRVGKVLGKTILFLQVSLDLGQMYLFAFALDPGNMPDIARISKRQYCAVSATPDF